MFEKEAEEYVMREDVITENDKVPFDNGYGFQTVSFEDEVKKGFKDGAEFGYNKANEWHKVTDWEDNSQFPNDELETYLVRLYQDHYVVCEIDVTEGYRQFYLSDNLEFIDLQEVIAWKEIVLPELADAEKRVKEIE